MQLTAHQLISCFSLLQSCTNINTWQKPALCLLSVLRSRAIWKFKNLFHNNTFNRSFGNKGKSCSSYMCFKYLFKQIACIFLHFLIYLCTHLFCHLVIYLSVVNFDKIPKDILAASGQIHFRLVWIIYFPHSLSISSFWNKIIISKPIS